MKKIEIVGKMGKIEIVIKAELNFQNFLKLENSDFSHKKGRVGKIGELFLKRWGITYFHTN